VRSRIPSDQPVTHPRERHKSRKEGLLARGGGVLVEVAGGVRAVRPSVIRIAPFGVDAFATSDASTTRSFTQPGSRAAPRRLTTMCLLPGLATCDP